MSIGEVGLMESKSKTSARRPGRPTTRLEPLETLPTRCPSSLHRYLKTVYPYRFNSLTELYEVMLSQFLETEPWKAGVHWRQPLTPMTRSQGQTGSTGWKLVNIQIPGWLKERVVNAAEFEGVSSATFAYTAMYWWAMFIMPANLVTGSVNVSSEG